MKGYIRLTRKHTKITGAALAVAFLLPVHNPRAQDLPPPPPEGGDEVFTDFGGGVPPPPPPSDSGGGDIGSGDPFTSPTGFDAGGGSGGGLKPPAATKNTALPKLQGAMSPANGTSPAQKVPPGKELVSIDFPEPTSIKDIIKTVAQWMGKNFILGAGISASAKIQIISPQLVTREEAYQAFLSALNVAGFTTVDTGKMVKIVPTRQASSANIKTFVNWVPRTDEVVTLIVTLKFIDAQALTGQLRTLMSDTKAVPVVSSNSIIFSDTGFKLRRVLELISALDRSGGNQVSMVQIANTDANHIFKKVNEVYGSRGPGSALYLQRVILEERTNSLILVGPPRGLDEVVRLIKRLDRVVDDPGSQAQIHVRPLDYADAEKLAATLQALTQGANQTNPLNRFLPPISRPLTTNANRPGGASNAVGTAAVADLGGVKITADKATNALIVQGSRMAFNQLDNIIKMLDKRRDQVYIEADIIDVNLTNGLDFKTSFAGAEKPGSNVITPFGWRAGEVAGILAQDKNNANPAGALAALGSNAVLGVMSSKPIDIAGIKLSAGAFIFALKRDENSNLLQSPNMVVADNEEAIFNASEKEWFQTTNYDASTRVTSAKREPVEASLELKIKPQISKANYINMDLNIKAENFGRRNANNEVAAINKRSTQSKVTVENQQTIVISGLTKDQDSDSKEKVPLLGDIPIIGWLFRSSVVNRAKTNLMIFITPYILRDSSDADLIVQKKMKAQDEYLGAVYGENYREKEVFKRLPKATDVGRRPSPPPVATPVPEQPPAEETNDVNKMPSEDPNPITGPMDMGAETITPADPGPSSGSGAPTPTAPGARAPALSAPAAPAPQLEIPGATGESGGGEAPPPPPPLPGVDLAPTTP